MGERERERAINGFIELKKVEMFSNQLIEALDKFF